MCPYGLRQIIRCPQKYGENNVERTNSSADPQKPLDERHIKNAAVIPDLRRPSTTRAVPAEERTTASSPLMIHGFTLPDYQQVYHSVVDPLLLSPCGKPKAYSLELGRTIKEYLFQELACPSLQISEHPNGEVEVEERFCLLRSTPLIDLDCTGEPQWCSSTDVPEHKSAFSSFVCLYLVFVWPPLLLKVVHRLFQMLFWTQKNFWCFVLKFFLYVLLKK